MQEYNEIVSIIGSVEKVLEVMETKQLGQEILKDIQQAVFEINTRLYQAPVVKLQEKHDLGKDGEYGAFIKETKELCRLWKQSLSYRCKGKVEREFWEWYEYFKYVDADVIYQRTVQHFMGLPEGLRIDFLALPHRYAFLKDKIDYIKGDFSLIQSYVRMMSEDVEKYRWLYEHLCDIRSKYVLNEIIRYWFGFDVERLHNLCETVFPVYFDMDILGQGEQEVFADLGVWNGESIKNFTELYGNYKKIYAYEENSAVCQSLQCNISDDSNLFLFNKKVGQKPDDMENGVKLDDEIKEPLTLIKMNIGGAEKEAIIGARKHILSDKPKLAIAGYHLPEDLFEIPYLIHEIRGDYKFYLRFSDHNGIWPIAIVIYAV